MQKTILDSLAFIGRSIPWLANQLRISKATVYRRLQTDEWTLPELRMMRQLFNWQTLEG